jgi:hypothetical protein
MKIRIGIDPPKGVAVAENGVIKKVITLHDMDEMFTYLIGVKALYASRDIAAIIERPYGIGTRRGKSLPVNVQKRISANIGMVMAEAKAIMSFCKAIGFPAEFRYPNKKYTKMNSELFARLTGYADRCSEHGRDAAMLAMERQP